LKAQVESENSHLGDLDDLVDSQEGLFAEENDLPRNDEGSLSANLSGDTRTDELATPLAQEGVEPRIIFSDSTVTQQK
jgi:hypothetical protein